MARRGLIFCGVLLWALSAGLARSAELDLFKAERFQGGPWRIRAETLTYDADHHLYTAKGRVEIVQGNRRICADEVELNDVTKIAVLKGNVVLTMGEDIFTGKEGRFNLATRDGELREARLFLKLNHFRVDSHLIRRTGDQTYYAEEAKVTTCDADKPLWTFSVRDLSVVLEGYAIGKDSKVYLGGVPVLYLPAAVLPVMNERQSGFLIPFYVLRSSSGFVAEIPFYWAMSNSDDATLEQTPMSRRGYMQGIEFRHQGHDDAAATFRFYYLDDGKLREPTDHRYWVSGMVNQPLPDDWFIRGTLDRVSDVDYLNDFNFGYMGLTRYTREQLQTFGRDLEQPDVFTRVSTFQLTRNFSWANFTSYGRYYEALHSATPYPYFPPYPYNRVPALALSSLSLPIGGSPLFFGLDSSYGYFLENHGMNGDRLDFHPQLALQGQPLSFVSFNSQVGYRGTLFQIDHTVPEGPPEGAVSRQLYDSQVGLSSCWARDYGREDDSSNFIRHTIQPEVTYWNIPWYDARRYPDFDPFDKGWVARPDRNLPVMKGDDPIGGVNALTYGISNQILWRGTNKEGQALTYDFLNFRLSQSTFFNSSSMGLDGTPQHHHPFSDFYGETEFHPLHQVVINTNLGVSPYVEGLDRSDFRLTLLDAKGKNYLSVNYIYIHNFAKEINVDAYLNLLQSVKTWVTYQKTFATSNQLTNQYGLVLQRQCWGVDLTYTDQPGNRRIGFTFFIPGLGEKTMRSPIHFPNEAQTKQSPDLF